MKTNFSTYGSLISRLLLAAGIATSALAGPPASTETRQRLSADWEHYQGSLGSPWEIWRGEKASDFSYAHDLAVQTAVLDACGLPLDR
jgi:hypothetical protein